MYSNVQHAHISNLQQLAAQLNVNAVTLLPHAKYCIANKYKLASNCAIQYASAHLATVQQIHSIFAQHNCKCNILQRICSVFAVNAQTPCIIYALNSNFINNTCTTFDIVVLNTQVTQSTYSYSLQNCNLNTLHAINKAIQQL